MIVNRLTVNDRDYFLPEPVTELKNKILSAIQAGGGYVNIPPLKSGTGVDILFSPGMPVVWTQLDVGADSADTTGSVLGASDHDELELGTDLDGEL